MARLPVLVVASLVACLAAVVPTFAQMGGGAGQAQAPQPPPPGTDGREPRAWFSNGSGGVGQQLTGSIALNGGTFRRLALEPDGAATDSAIAAMSGGLYYSLDGGRAGITAGYQGFASRYGDLTEDTLYGHSGTVTGNLSLSARTTVSASQGVYYEPPVARSLGSIFDPGGGAILPGIDVGAIEDRALSYISSADVRHQFSTRTDLSVGYRHWVFDMRGEDGESGTRDQVTDDALAQLTHILGAGFSLRLGYRYAG